jgi:molybdopterin-guanine dinucleotide biosynthesis protein A
MEGSPQTVACVLAGGRATRLGRPKATAQLGGRALISYPLGALAEAGFERVVVVAKHDSVLPPLRMPIWTEPDEPVHPLAGVLTALDRSEGLAVLAVGCDMPFLEPALLLHLAAAPGPVAVPRVAGSLQPLCARYEPATAEVLRTAVVEGSAAHGAIEEIGPKVLDEDELRRFGDPERMFFNVNTPEDLARAQGMLTG